MSNGDVEFRFDAAVRSAAPVQALRRLAMELRRENTRLPQIYELFERHRAACIERSDASAADAILDALQRAFSWQMPSASLVNPTLGVSPKEVAAQFVQPFFLKFLHGNFSSPEMFHRGPGEQAQFFVAARDTLARVSPAVIDYLFDQPDSRGLFMAAWFCGLKGWQQYLDRIAELLLSSSGYYPDQGYSVAMAFFASPVAAGHVIQFIEQSANDGRVFPSNKAWIIQEWALPALSWIDERLRAARSHVYYEAGGVFELCSSVRKGKSASADDCIRRFSDLMKLAIKAFDIRVV
jgi:Family of unknown function (DUF6000)